MKFEEGKKYWAIQKLEDFEKDLCRLVMPYQISFDKSLDLDQRYVFGSEKEALEAYESYLYGLYKYYEQQSYQINETLIEVREKLNEF